MSDFYYKSLTTPVLRKMYERKRSSLMALPESERKSEDVSELIAMRDELDRRVGRPQAVDFDFEKYITN